MPGTGRVLSSLTQYSLHHGMFWVNAQTNLGRLKNVKVLTLTTQRWARTRKTSDEDDENLNQPIKFSTSKASQKNWNVERSMGSHYRRPVWKVLPLSIFTMGVLLWCALRGETDVDQKLKKDLYEQLPGLLSDEDEETQGK